MLLNILSPAYHKQRLLNFIYSIDLNLVKLGWLLLTSQRLYFYKGSSISNMNKDTTANRALIPWQ